MRFCFLNEVKDSPLQCCSSQCDVPSASLTHPCCLWCSSPQPVSCEHTRFQLEPRLAELSPGVVTSALGHHNSALARTQLLGWGSSPGCSLQLSFGWKWSSITFPPCWCCLWLWGFCTRGLALLCKGGTKWAHTGWKWLVKHISVKAGERELGTGIGQRREEIKFTYFGFGSSSRLVRCVVYLIPSCMREKKIKLFALFCGPSWEVLPSSAPNSLI